MDGFKNSTKTQYDTMSGKTFANGGMVVSRNDMPGGQGPMSKPAMVAKYAKGGAVKKGEQKIGRVMKEFTEGKLHSGSKEGPKVKSTKQAVAIALNEARAAGAKIPRVKRAEGTPMGKGPESDDVFMARMTKDELAQGKKGIRMARERMSKEQVKMPMRKGVPVDSRKAMIGSPEAADTYLARMPRGAVKPAESTGPFRVLRGRSGLKNGGLATMPKKGC
jgi:hypothetical protein